MYYVTAVCACRYSKVNYSTVSTISFDEKSFSLATT